MSNELSREQVIDILQYIGVTVRDRGKDNLQYCCPVHQENTPSMGFSFSKGLCHCFSCHFSGTLEWLVYKTLPDEFKSVQEVQRWILDKYNVDIREEERIQGRNLRRYEDMEEDIIEEEVKRFELPKSYIAPFKSGKETYKYFFDRGFTKQTMKDFMIGRDLEKQTVTIPIFHADGVLAGVIGRYIDLNRAKNCRYAVYEFPKGTLLYPIHKFKPRVINGKKVAILVEGNLDSLWLHQQGYSEALAIQGNALTKAQAILLEEYEIDTFILMYDGDKGGIVAKDITKKNLGDNYTFRHVQYPEGFKDPQEMSKEQLDLMIEKALFPRKTIRRL